MGKSGHIGSKVAATLASTGTAAFFVHPGEASHGDLGMITAEDLVIALSNSGETGEITALNASGRSGALATPEFFAAAGVDRVPGVGPLSVSVPGAVAGWVDAHERFGSMDFAELLATGIDYARDGFAVSTRLAQDFEEQGANLNQAGKDLYLPNAAPPPVGSPARSTTAGARARSTASTASTATRAWATRSPADGAPRWLVPTAR